MDEPPMVTAAGRAFASSVDWEAHWREMGCDVDADRKALRRLAKAAVDQDDGPLALPAWALSILIAVVCFGGPTIGSVLGLAMIFQGLALPILWAVLLALIWTGAAVGWLVFLVRVRP